VLILTPAHEARLKPSAKNLALYSTLQVIGLANSISEKTRKRRLDTSLTVGAAWYRSCVLYKVEVKWFWLTQREGSLGYES